MVPKAEQIPAGIPLISKVRIDNIWGIEKGKTKKKLFKKPIKKFLEFNDEYSKNEKKFLSNSISSVVSNKFFPSKIAI